MKFNIMEKTCNTTERIVPIPCNTVNPKKKKWVDICIEIIFEKKKPGVIKDNINSF